MGNFGLALAAANAAALLGLSFALWRRRRGWPQPISSLSSSGRPLLLSSLSSSLICEPCALPEDAIGEWLALCHKLRRARRNRPFQSNFRVAALVTFRLDGQTDVLHHVIGHNDEACNLRNSCCAERAAFLQVASHAGASQKVDIRAVFITSDAPHALTPGAMCREYMLSSPWTTPEMPVYMEGEDGPSSRDAGTLAQLWPLPSPYTRLDRDGQLACGERLREKVGAALEARLRAQGNGDEAKVYAAASAACVADDRHDVHPISYAAAALFADGTIATATQIKATEYGCSLDAVCQLAPAIAARAPSKPTLLCMADQFGVLHAPFSSARAYLIEHGHGDVRLLVHDTEGALHRPRAGELMPSTPQHTFT